MPLPTSLVVNCLDELLPVITAVVNLSLKEGYFPSEWKDAIVKPLFKKAGLSMDNKNLRQMSNLQFVSKVTERAVFDQLHKHLEDNDLYPVFQSAYIRQHSTETALLRIFKDILHNQDIIEHHVTLQVLMDLSSAFDTVDGDIMIRRFEMSFGITGTELQWLRSYLPGRSQHVIVNGERSESLNLPFGVPQGSCLGPLLFTLYSSKLFEVIKPHLPEAHAYADDSQLYLSFKPNNEVNESEAVKSMEFCIRAIRTWMWMDKLKLNDDKTEFMIIGSRQQLEKVSVAELSFGDISVAPVSTARNLGVPFDRNLKFDAQITKTYCTGYYYLHNIRKISKYVTLDSTRCLVHALLIGRVDYCNSLLHGLPRNNINKLQRLQNMAARLTTNTPRFCHITPVSGLNSR